jgi:hypothetical protein
MPNNFRVKGAFFENDKQTGPAFTGFIEIDGVRTEIALWPKTARSGVNYFQVSEDKKKNPGGSLKTTAGPATGSPFAKKAPPQAPKKPIDPFDDGDDGDGIPF